MCRTAAADPKNDYLLLIDEINRGNVPRIFGELITLLEADKRGVSVTLPQSGEAFSVPPNLHVIGTMNTADRSIHLLDVALRRRFAFVALLPEPDLLANSSIGPLNLEIFLTELNRRVIERAGRERQLGHAVLMGPGGTAITDPTVFASAFRYEILPLLQEYLYEDYRDLASVLGSEIIDAEAQTSRWEVIDDPEALVKALAQELDAQPSTVDE
jgi:5-methylcytosine-specific restriction protein B